VFGAVAHALILPKLQIGKLKVIEPSGGYQTRPWLVIPRPDSGVIVETPDRSFDEVVRAQLETAAQLSVVAATDADLARDPTQHLPQCTLVTNLGSSVYALTSRPGVSRGHCISVVQNRPVNGSTA
jgi:hypothetical protein